eukprot:448530-Pleurochrysis_carterae.AAC.2
MKETRQNRGQVKVKILKSLHMRDKLNTKSKTLRRLDKSLKKYRQAGIALYPRDFEIYAKKYAKSDEERKEYPEGTFLASVPNMTESELLLKVRG